MVGEKNFKKQYKEDGTVIECTITCPLCGVEQVPFNVMYSDYEAWRCGTFAHVAFPYLTSSERELLISGTCDPCWSRLVDGL